MRSQLLLAALLLTSLSVTAQNKVGIGTTTPTEQLHTTEGVRFEKLSGNNTRPLYVDATGKLVSSNEYIAGTVGQNILDNNCASPVNSPITVTGLAAPVNSNNIIVKVNISHSFDGDLSLLLVSPVGDTIFLSNGLGGAGDNYTNTVFKTGGAAISSGTAPFTGTFAPQGLSGTSICSGLNAMRSNRNSFTEFGGGTIIPNGTWKLFCFDIQTGDQGSLLNWSIAFDGNLPDNKVSARSFFKCVPFNDIVLASSATTKLTYATLLANDEGAYNASTGTYTAPVSGLYEFTVNTQWYITGLGATEFGVFAQYITVNGTISYYFTTEHTNTGFVGKTCNSIAQLHLNAGDVVEFYAGNSSSQTQSIMRSSFAVPANTGYMSHISGRRIYAD